MAELKLITTNPYIGSMNPSNYHGLHAAYELGKHDQLSADQVVVAALKAEYEQKIKELQQKANDRPLSKQEKRCLKAGYVARAAQLKQKRFDEGEK